MPWVENHRTTQDSEESVRRARVRFLERSDLMLLLFLKETGTLVGSSGLHRMDWTVPKFEIGYWCRSRFTGKGYITEAVRSISAFAFEALDARREIRCDSQNHRSVKVAEKSSFTLEGKLRNDACAPGGSMRDTLIFSAVPEDETAGT